MLKISSRPLSLCLLSNRDQSGIVCVRGKATDGTMEDCAPDSTTGVLQDTNTALSTTAEQRATNIAEAQARCIDQANAANSGVANDQGATSCITSTTGTSSDILTKATFTTEQAANDGMGDGHKEACKKIEWFNNSTNTTVSYLVLAIVLAFVGFAAAWASVYCYNRIKARREALKETKFEGDTAWKRATDDKTVI